MNISKIITAGSAIFLLALSMTGQTALASGNHDGDSDSDSESNDDGGRSAACFRTTRLMLRACRADIVDDLNEQLAKCLNSDENRECRREARREYHEARGDCKDQAESRDNLCERLPDQGPYVADLDPADFGGCSGQNQFFPLEPGTVTTFVNDADEEELETIVVTVTDETREIEGIETFVVRDTVYEGLPDGDGNVTDDQERIEDTDDYYALDNDCNVWYLGEVSQNFEDGYLNNLDGSFIAGEEGAQAGIIMLADPQVGDVYRQEFALGDAEDAGAVLDLAAIIYNEEGAPFEAEDEAFECASLADMCLKTEDFIGNDPEGQEFKYFKPGIGFVAEQLPDGDVVLRLIKVELPD